MFLCYYVHNSIVFIIAMFNYFITLLQHVRSQSATTTTLTLSLTLLELTSVSPRLKYTRLLVRTGSEIGFFVISANYYVTRSQPFSVHLIDRDSSLQFGNQLT